MLLTLMTTGALARQREAIRRIDDDGLGKSLARLATRCASSSRFFAQDDKTPGLLVMGRRGLVGGIEDDLDQFLINRPLLELADAVAPVDGFEGFVGYHAVCHS